MVEPLQGVSDHVSHSGSIDPISSPVVGGRRGVRGASALLFAVVAVAVVAILVKTDWISFGHGETTATAGDVLEKKLEARRELRVGVGTFMVPVVVCDETIIPFVEGRSKDGKSIDEACNTPGDEGTTLLVEGSVEAIIPVDRITVTTDRSKPGRVVIEAPAPSMQPPEIDARDVLVVARDPSIIPGTDLPDNYQALAADRAADAISAVAKTSGLPKLAHDSAEAQLRDLFSPAFEDVVVQIGEPDPSGD